MRYYLITFCESCGEIETIEHYFFNCEQVEEFWRELGTISIEQKITSYGESRTNLTRDPLWISKCSRHCEFHHSVGKTLHCSAAFSGFRHFMSGVFTITTKEL